MLHWKITNRGFALWRCQELTKLNNYNSGAQGMWTQLRPSVPKLQELLDVQIPCSWTLQSLEWGRGSELILGISTTTNTPTTPGLKCQSFSTACTSSSGSSAEKGVPASSSTLSKQNSSGGKFVFPPTCKQEKHWSRRFVQSRCDALIISKYTRNSKPAQKRHPRYKSKK